MAEADKRPVHPGRGSCLQSAQTDALAKLLIQKRLITREESIRKISEERETHQRLLNPITQ